MDENGLISEIESLKKDKEVSNLVEKRIKEFEKIQNANEKVWFEELCFCLLTANSGARICLRVIESAKEQNMLLDSDDEALSKALRSCGYRFYNRRAQFIVDARGSMGNLKREIKGRNEKEAREWLVKNIKGIGLKEASHFLRNIGYKNLAILDRHILKILFEYGLIKEIPTSLSKKKYYEIEEVLGKLTQKTRLSLAELDLYMWYMKTGEVLK